MMSVILQRGGWGSDIAYCLLRWNVMPPEQNPRIRRLLNEDRGKLTLPLDATDSFQSTVVLKSLNFT